MPLSLEDSCIQAVRDKQDTILGLGRHVSDKTYFQFLSFPDKLSF